MRDSKEEPCGHEGFQTSPKKDILHLMMGMDQIRVLSPDGKPVPIPVQEYGEETLRQPAFVEMTCQVESVKYIYDNIASPIRA